MVPGSHPIAMARRFTALATIAVFSAACGQIQRTSEQRQVSYDARSFALGGERVLLLSGSIHYPRVPVGDWGQVLRQAAAMGLNTIQTYVFWSFHEPEKGVSDWSGQRNLTHFIQLAQENGLYVILRVGPYICGEYSYGGIPVWMRDEGAKCFRCSDPVWRREMARFVGDVIDRVTPFLYPRGGPIVLLQIENEYRGADLDYLRWAVDMARNCTTEVPWVLCHDLISCTSVNTGKDLALCTINDVWEDTPKFFTQPSPGWLAEFRRRNPTQPAAWTEDQGWYDAWGHGQLVRDPAEELYGIARWLAYGGALHNFYMLTGGNNYERRAGLGVATAYAPDTPIDNLFLSAPKYRWFRAFFASVTAVSGALLAAPVPQPVPFPPDPSVRRHTATTHEERGCGPSFPVGAESHRYGDLVFLSNYNTAANGSRTVVFAGRRYYLTNRTVVLVNISSGAVLTNTSDPLAFAPSHQQRSASAMTADVERVADTKKSGGIERTTQSVAESSRATARAATIEWFAEPLVACADQNTTLSMHGPLEQLVLTRDTTDYLWYSTEIPAAVVARDNVTLEVDGGLGTIFYAYVDGKQLPVVVNSSGGGISDSGGSNGGGGGSSGGSGGGGGRSGGGSGGIDNAAARRTNTVNSLSPREDEANVTLSILSVAMGMPNVNPQPNNSKGITGHVVLTWPEPHGGHVVLDVTTRMPWRMAWPLVGQAKHAEAANATTAVPWHPLDRLDSQLPPANTGVWFRMTIDLPPSSSPPQHSATPTRASPLSGAQPPQPSPTLVVKPPPLPPPPSSSSSQGGQTAFALDLSGMNKGVAYVNGFDIGRYWLAPSSGCADGDCAPPNFPGPICYFRYKACGKPTQHLYHVPTEALRPTGNVVVLFDESSSVQPRRPETVTLVALHHHPSIN